MEYTKGDWHARVIDNEWSITSDIGRIARLGKNTSKYPEAEANARLIALCPTMFEYIQERASGGDSKAQGIVQRFTNR